MAKYVLTYNETDGLYRGKLRSGRRLVAETFTHETEAEILEWAGDIAEMDFEVQRSDDR